MSIYRTKSLLHGLGQVRERSFYFFWKGDKVPVLDWFDTPYVQIQDMILNTSKRLSQNDVTNSRTPSKDDPFYRYVLEEMEHCTHSQFVARIEKTTDVMWHVEKAGISYVAVSEWMKKNGYDKLAKRCLAMDAKLKGGGNIMRRSTLLPKNFMGAFVGHIPTSLAHPIEDRYITVREALRIMTMPDDFELLEPKKNLNHICQNVPVTTARDMMHEIMEVLDGNRRMIKPDGDENVWYQFNTSQTQKFTDFEYREPDLAASLYDYCV
jgi:site-specific DNA-cytosine methylase